MTNPERIAKGLYWDRAWSLIGGCTHCSPGCDNCWAARETNMRAAQKNPKIRDRYTGLTDQDGKWTGRIRLMEKNLDLPLRVKKPTTWAVWNDLFHETVEVEFIDKAFAVMALCQQHIFLVLTKRPERMREYLMERAVGGRHVWRAGQDIKMPRGIHKPAVPWPLPNVWLGVTVENQEMADERIPILLQVPAAVRWISVEPMLSALDLRPYLWPEADNTEKTWPDDNRARIGWIVAGGESGPGARPMHPDWIRSLQDQCVVAGVPFLLKQHGEWIHAPHFDSTLEGCASCYLKTNGSIGDHTDGIKMIRVGKKKAGRLLDGREWSQFPVIAHG